MAGIDILSLQPHQVDKSLCGKYLLVYGAPKIGKTAFCAKDIPKTLLCCFEKGYNAVAGVIPANIDDWSTFKTLVRQLELDEAKEKFQNICIDTATTACQFCADYICKQYGVETLAEISHGRGWSLYRNEMSALFRKITRLGYGVTFITHEKDSSREDNTPEKTAIRCVAPDLDKKAMEVINGLVDFTLYIKTEWENGQPKRYFYARETPTIMAGSRFKHMAPKFPFGYESMLKALSDAIEAEESESPGMVVDRSVTNELMDQEKRPFSETMEEAGRLWNQLPSTDEWKKRKQDAVKEYFGEFVKLSSATENQQELVEGVISELRRMVKEIEE